MSAPSPARGDIWLADFDPIRGHEQAGTRPGLVISVDPFNEGPTGLVVLVPLTSTDRRVPLHVEVTPPDGAVRSRSFAMCESLRSVSKERLITRWGTVSPETITLVEDRLRILLGL